jgi:hypothetical protein
MQPLGLPFPSPPPRSCLFFMDVSFCCSAINLILIYDRVSLLSDRILRYWVRSPSLCGCVADRPLGRLESGNWCCGCACWTSPLGVHLSLLLYSKGRYYKEVNRVGYNMISIRTLPLLVYFIYIFIDIIIYILGSTPSSSEIFWMVDRVVVDPSLNFLSLCRLIPRLPILVVATRMIEIVNIDGLLHLLRVSHPSVDQTQS